MRNGDGQAGGADGAAGAPLVSVLLPTCNRAAYLPERIASIERQTFRDFEVIVCDSNSTDGSRELLGAWARRDARARVFQVPRAGIYPAWNECLRRARGKYVHWATSDDTMAPETLERLLGGLSRHPGCRVALCGLAVVGDDGRLVPGEAQWLNSPWGVFWGRLGFLEREHVRRAPLDMALAGALHNPWHSSNQLLVERSLYAELGGYRTDLGPGADFEWNIRAAAVADAVFVPGAMAVLRRHGGSATALNRTRNTADMDIKIRILSLALEWLRGRDAGLAARLEAAGWREPFLLQGAFYHWRERGWLRGLPALARFLAGGGLSRAGFALCFLANAARGKEAVRGALARRVARRAGLPL
ncbi:MAG: glycosyltransferase [Opitutaceae bacterium]|jgi:glycosyltransferase involved in cell wall biosynthesis|nr:glycosyltransferase [Opitutaceae bacterium]